MQVFVSHSFKDEKFAKKLRDVLLPFDIDAILAQENPRFDKNLRDKIIQDLKSSMFVIGIITQNSNESISVQQELGFAQGTGIPIIVMRKKDVKFPGALIDGLEYAEFTDSTFEKSCSGLIHFIQNYNSNILENIDHSFEHQKLIDEHLSSLLKHFIKFREENQATIIDWNIQRPKTGYLNLDEILLNYPKFDSLISHFYTDKNNKIIFELFHQIRLIDKTMITLENSLNIFQKETIEKIAITLKRKYGFKQRGRLLSSKTESLFLSDFTDGFQNYSMNDDPKLIHVLPAENPKFKNAYSIRFPGWGQFGNYKKTTANFIVKELNKSFKIIKKTITDFKQNIETRHTVRRVFTNQINELINNFDIGTGPLAGYCEFCAKERFYDKFLISSLGKKLSEIPWDEIHKPELPILSDNYLTVKSVHPKFFEVIIDDPDISGIDEAHGVPDITINKKHLKMAQAMDGRWYAYFGSKHMSSTTLGKHIAKIPILNASPSILPVTGLGQNELNQSICPLYQKLDYSQSSTIDYHRGGRLYSVSLKDFHWINHRLFLGH